VRLPRRRGALACVAGAVALALALTAVALLLAAARPVLQGWLLAFVVASEIPIGCVVLLAIHRLTGGRWGEDLRPAFAAGVALMPMVLIAFLPIAAASVLIFPWGASVGVPADVARLYLDPALFALRSAAMLIVWAVLGALAVRRRLGQLPAALGLALHVVAIGAIATDWVLSLDPSYRATAFGAAFGVQQLLAALAWAAMLAPEPGGERTAGDLGGLLIATIAGTVYLGLMTFVVVWYGDLPDKAAWFLARGRDGWGWVILAAFLLGALMPFLALLLSRVRHDRLALRLVGAMILAGILLHDAWLMGPALDPWALPAAAVTLIAMAAFGVALLSRREAGEARHVG
jgi:hypothetical protein